MRRKILFHMASVTFLALPEIVYGLTPVIDTTAIGQAAENQIANIAKFSAQVDLLTNQVDLLTNQMKQMEKDYGAITGARTFGDILKNETFKDNLPDNWESTYNKIRDSGYNGLTAEAKSIYDKNKIFDKCQHFLSIEEKKICEAQSVKAAQDQAFVMEALKKSDERMNNIKKLSDQIKNTQDPKGIAELQARIAVEQNTISNDRARLELFKMASEAEENILRQKKSEIIAQDAAKHGGIDIEPLTFD